MPDFAIILNSPTRLIGGSKSYFLPIFFSSESYLLLNFLWSYLFFLANLTSYLIFKANLTSYLMGIGTLILNTQQLEIG